MLQVQTTKGVSSIDGIGVFAAADITKGSVIWRFTPGIDLLLTKEELDRLSPIERAHILHYCYLWRKAMRYIVCADDARFFNHSDTPNARVVQDDTGTTIAARNIFLGEELTCDYEELDASDRTEFDNES
ncbi:SET domain-containing protein [Candidatus Peregrinibacteria bacterium]|nr:SET domain-containing protein [Candidatus Peregrinibacteria bacterium]MBI2524298.1 SET domain-containing protein [Candidatus Peregrinibacteria bacterium]